MMPVARTGLPIHMYQRAAMFEQEGRGQPDRAVRGTDRRPSNKPTRRDAPQSCSKRLRLAKSTEL
jgi:hypothetical protein